MSEENKVPDDSGAGSRKSTRREFLGNIIRVGALLTIGAGTLGLLRRAGKDKLVWQLDPNKCIQCGRCETNCVLTPSAVKCTQDFPICGYCQRCFGFHHPRSEAYGTNGFEQLCPVGALHRKLVEEPYYEYTVDEKLCVGCGLCVKGCLQFGNGSLYLQTHHDRCLNCNECSIAIKCPANAWTRVPSSQPYILKSKRST